MLTTTYVEGGNGRAAGNADRACKAKVVVEVHLDHDLGLEYPVGPSFTRTSWPN